MSRLFQIALLLTILSIVGCAPIPVTQTNKLADYTSKPERIVLMPVIADSLRADQVNLFETEFLASLRECGLTVTAQPVSAAPNASFMAAVLRGNGGATHADSLLVVQTAEKGTTGGYGQTSVGYGLSLDDLVSKRTVWKAIVTIGWDPAFGDRRVLGHALAAAAVAAMQKDNLLPERCASAK